MESSAFGPGFSNRLLRSLSEGRGDVRRFHPGRRGTGAQIRGTPKSVVFRDLAALSSSPQLLTNPYFFQDYNIDEEAALQAALALSLSEN